METLDYVAIAVDEEFGEIPFYVARRLCSREVVLLQEFAQACDGGLGGVVLRPGSLEEFVDRVRAVAIHFDLCKLVEGGVVFERAELMDFIVAARRLVAELVAGEVEDFQPAGVVFGVEFLKALVLRSEAAAGGGVDDEQDLAFERGEIEARSVAALGREVVYGHCGFLFWR